MDRLLFFTETRLQCKNNRSPSVERKPSAKGAAEGAIIGEVPLVVPSKNGRKGTKGNYF